MKTDLKVYDTISIRPGKPRWWWRLLHPFWRPEPERYVVYTVDRSEGLDCIDCTVLYSRCTECQSDNWRITDRAPLPSGLVYELKCRDCGEVWLVPAPKRKEAS